MEWINFAKRPPEVKGLNCVAISGVGVASPYAYVLCMWDSKSFQNVYSNIIYPCSSYEAGNVVYSATPIWYISITTPPRG